MTKGVGGRRGGGWDVESGSGGERKERRGKRKVGGREGGKIKGE